MILILLVFGHEVVYLFLFITLTSWFYFLLSTYANAMVTQYMDAVLLIVL